MFIIMISCVNYVTLVSDDCGLAFIDKAYLWLVSFCIQEDAVGSTWSIIDYVFDLIGLWVANVFKIWKLDHNLPNKAII